MGAAGVEPAVTTVIGTAGTLINLGGTDATGTNDLGNTLSGIFATNSAFNVIGGTNGTNRNVISGNNQQGVHLGGTNSFGNQVLGNFIGLGAVGSNAVASPAT